MFFFISDTTVLVAVLCSVFITFGVILTAAVVVAILYWLARKRGKKGIYTIEPKHEG